LLCCCTVLVARFTFCLKAPYPASQDIHTGWPAGWPSLPPARIPLRWPVRPQIGSPLGFRRRSRSGRWPNHSRVLLLAAQRKLVTLDSTRPFVSGRVCGRRRPSPLSRCQHSFLPGTRAPSPRVSMEHLLHFSVHYTSASHHSTSRRASPPTTLISAFLVPPITGLLQPHRGSHSLPRGTGQQADSLFFGGRAAQFYSSCCTAPPPSVRIARLLPTLSCNFRVPGPSP